MRYRYVYIYIYRQPLYATAASPNDAWQSHSHWMPDAWASSSVSPAWLANSGRPNENDLELGPVGKGYVIW